MNDITVKALGELVGAAKELVTRVDAPEKIPDTCYRGDVSRWNFGYFLSRRDKLGSRITADEGKTLAEIISDFYGDSSEELRYYNRAVALCKSYQSVYDLEIKDI